MNANTPADEPHGDIVDLLGDYLDRGEQPPRELLENSPENDLAFAALVRMREVAATLVEVDAEGSGEPEDDGWVQNILGSIQREVRSGRSIPLTHPSPRASLSLTEGAVRGLVRAAGDSVDGVLIGRCSIEGDVETPHAPVVVRVEASVFWGERIPELAERLRAAIGAALLQHTELAVEAIDVIVTDVHLRRSSPADAPAATAESETAVADERPVAPHEEGTPE
ncbi:Asp23/Gls24 family envelope stress response protein [Herbiconiux sp. 11R-BC]|uniref:Asp23/Gls24 family envelope stress response protein n=1 Tax=Herbiconiux sp. 11R-BC TaxID=3111637 RepID=UPI003C0F0F99